jgi:3-isopropylmalate/(R)-2-methylmalate dehydratase small subunit
MQTANKTHPSPNAFPSPLSSPVIPLPHNDVDTDQIIPARYLKVTDKNGLAEGLFYEWRYQADGSPKAAFPLNQPAYQGAQIMVAGDNFGCGSSREHAPWALTGWGIRAVVSTRFADIFHNNAVKNGLLLVRVVEEVQQKLFKLTADDPAARVSIDLENQRLVFPDGSSVLFPMDPFDKRCLLEGVDQLGYLFKFIPQIQAYEEAHEIK